MAEALLFTVRSGEGRLRSGISKYIDFQMAPAAPARRSAIVILPSHLELKTTRNPES